MSGQQPTGKPLFATPVPGVSIGGNLTNWLTSETVAFATTLTDSGQTPIRERTAARTAEMLPVADQLYPSGSFGLNTAVEDPSRDTLLNLLAFATNVRNASLYMSAAFRTAGVNDFDFKPAAQQAVESAVLQKDWYAAQVKETLVEISCLRGALVHSWTPTAEAAPIADQAFDLLCKLTTAPQLLKPMYHKDPRRASLEAAKFLELATEKFRLAWALFDDSKDASAATPAPADFRVFSEKLLENAGGGLSLTQAAEILNVTRQALHKRVKLGTALGLMVGREIVLPKMQFVSDADGKLAIVAGLGDVVRSFEEAKAGRWSAFQFLIEQDPNLGVAPIEALKQARAKDVAHAATAFLGSDEG